MGDDTPERWLPVVGYEGFYEVSDLGRIRSKRRRGAPGGILKPPSDTNGYRQIALSSNGVTRLKRVHVLVLQAFVGPRPPGCVACHGPGGRQDNRLLNLRWDTYKANEADKIRDKTDQAGTRNAMAKLSETSVRDIRKRYLAGETQTRLAQEYGVAVSNVCLIVHRVTWQHVL